MSMIEQTGRMTASAIACADHGKTTGAKRVVRDATPDTIQDTARTVARFAPLGRILRYLRGRQVLGRLDRLDDRMLADIGLRRDDVLAARLGVGGHDALTAIRQAREANLRDATLRTQRPLMRS